jgi:hypothetical protein
MKVAMAGMPRSRAKNRAGNPSGEWQTASASSQASRIALDTSPATFAAITRSSRSNRQVLASLASSVPPSAVPIRWRNRTGIE